MVKPLFQALCSLYIHIYSFNQPWHLLFLLPPSIFQTVWKMRGSLFIHRSIHVKLQAQLEHTSARCSGNNNYPVTIISYLAGGCEQEDEGGGGGGGGGIEGKDAVDNSPKRLFSCHERENGLE